MACDLSLMQNAKQGAAEIRIRLPKINLLVLRYVRLYILKLGLCQ